ncbi:MAG: lipid-A-disaccharide synthase [Zetaproteobacteria bacterium CG12_big_fil_rev_8_21_14_0_65_54_13]|nr:MAG: lipid-A-disaccharide synthase [Zetaproteobacteria bacterium CG12_big_fil_rev_8_21_14_0_65_54_13]PIX55801.1 MAG: lipid-A-disaccharide synthase [Zetaproteobacteria bacterium CG_4_10_14_3_um_filter_54_28]PJA29951.1 MAG: lipid-A-disaccharide synthase [Zetaproteobacteria bacterium CG_4_9_14_3_um_filter_54_145]
MRIFISAGETSGDMHAATVVAELRSRFPDASIHGIAGLRMQAAGCTVLHDMAELNVMGLGEVLAALSRIRRVEASVLGWCEQQQPDVAVLVDFSSFHMRLGRKLRALGIPVIHFVAPKLWAWGSWRVRKLRQSQDALACILPFEPEWFAARGIAARFVGNPSAEACANGWSAAALKQRLGLTEGQTLLALLPGSRPQELRTHVPLLAEVLQRMREHCPDIACVVPVAPGVAMAALEPLWQAGAMPIRREEEGYALRADLAVAVSGTATLELALWDVPTLLVYKTSPLFAFLARRLVQLQCAGLANIILDDKPVMPELIQQACTVDQIMLHLLPLLDDGKSAAAQRTAFKQLRQRLGQHRVAANVVDMVEQQLDKS